MQFFTMPVEKRAGIAGRHIVTKGEPAPTVREDLVTGTER